MDTSDLLVGFASFMGSLIVISRVLAWSVLLARPSNTSAGAAAHKRSLFELVPLVFHSGPWTLVLAAGGIYWAGRSYGSRYMASALAGFGVAVALVLGGYLLAALRQRRPATHLPLTPERLLAIRQRFYWGNSLLFGACSSASAFFLYGFTPKEAPGFAVLLFPMGFLVGWIWCWFMWQWYGAALQVGEKRRRQREEHNAV